MENSKITIDNENFVKLRLDIFLAEKLQNMSRSRLQKLIKDGQILVNDEKAKQNYFLNLNDIISVNIPEALELSIDAENLPLNILFEDDCVIVINKEKGMVVHPGAGHYSGTLVNALMFHCGNNLSGINGVLRPGIVHRIDKDTSGILVVAKNDLAHRHLSKQLSEHSMNRVYHAIVHGGFSVKDGIIDKPIGRHPIDRKKMAITNRSSKNAITNFKVLEKIGRFTLIEAKLETGRTHQIRVHMASILHPLLGDEVYGPKIHPLRISGQMLHAKLLGFKHPRTDEYIEFESNLPNYFENILHELRRK